MDDKLLTPQEVADRLGVSVACLNKWRLLGGGPPYVRLGHHCVRYRPEAIERWLAEREHAHRAAELAAGAKP